MRHCRLLTVVAAALLVPTLTLAWTPGDTYDPGAEAMPPMNPAQLSDRFGPMAPLPLSTQTGGLRLLQSTTDDAYLLEIPLSGVMPEQIKIEARGPWLRITRDNRAQASQEETLSDGRGWRRSFTYSSATLSRTLRVPQDGNPGALQRQDTPDAVRISIPRTRASTDLR